MEENAAKLSGVFTALHFAANKHAQQRRKGGEQKTPYVNHVIAVAEVLTACGIDDPEILMAALLHDVIEDQGVTSQELQDKFGARVANIVVGCSDDKKLNKIQRKQDQIEHAKKANDDVKVVKLGDKYSNLSDLLQCPPKSWSSEKIEGYFYWAQEVCKECYGVNSLLDGKLKQLFEKFNVSSDETVVAGKLKHYYAIIDKSE